MKIIFSLLFLGLIIVSSPTGAQEKLTGDAQQIPSYVGIGVKMHPLFASKESELIAFVTVFSLVCDGPADRAGLKKLDLVMSVDGQFLGGNRLTLKGFGDVLKTITSGNIGDPVILLVDSLGEEGAGPREITILREEVTNPVFGKNCDK